MALLLLGRCLLHQIRLDDRAPDVFAARLAAELDRLDRYAAAGDIAPQAIPAAVRAVARRLRPDLAGPPGC